MKEQTPTTDFNFFYLVQITTSILKEYVFVNY